MKINKEIRQRSRALLRESFTDGQLDRGLVAARVDSLVAERPRHYLAVLEHYKRLLRLEVEKRHARIESATQLSPQVSSNVASNLKTKYGNDLTTEFVVKPELLGGMRVRVGSNVWDGTVRNRLQRLQQQL